MRPRDLALLVLPNDLACCVGNWGREQFLTPWLDRVSRHTYISNVQIGRANVKRGVLLATDRPEIAAKLARLTLDELGYSKATVSRAVPLRLPKPEGVRVLEGEDGSLVGSYKDYRLTLGSGELERIWGQHLLLTLAFKSGSRALREALTAGRALDSLALQGLAEADDELAHWMDVATWGWSCPGMLPERVDWVVLRAAMVAHHLGRKAGLRGSAISAPVIVGDLLRRAM